MRKPRWRLGKQGGQGNHHNHIWRQTETRCWWWHGLYTWQSQDLNSDPHLLFKEGGRRGPTGGQGKQVDREETDSQWRPSHEGGHRRLSGDNCPMENCCWDLVFTPTLSCLKFFMVCLDVTRMWEPGLPMEPRVPGVLPALGHEQVPSCLLFSVESRQLEGESGYKEW